MWKDNAKAWYIRRCNVDTVKAVCNIQFYEGNRTTRRVGKQDVTEYALQSVAKLHGVRWG